MLTININVFAEKINKANAELNLLIQSKLPAIIGIEAVNHFKENFQREGFDKEKWKEVQRRTGGTKAFKYNSKHHPTRTTRKILTGDTGDLGRSIQHTEWAGKVTIHSDLD
jgi:hypothetical protein